MEKATNEDEGETKTKKGKKRKDYLAPGEGDGEERLEKAQQKENTLFTMREKKSAREKREGKRGKGVQRTEAKRAPIHVEAPHASSPEDCACQWEPVPADREEGGQSRGSTTTGSGEGKGKTHLFEVLRSSGLSEVAEVFDDASKVLRVILSVVVEVFADLATPVLRLELSAGVDFGAPPREVESDRIEQARCSGDTR